MHKAKVLIVEDEAIVAVDLKNTILKLDTFVTDIVSNHDDALQSIDTNEPDIILMDINLDNDIDGIDVVKSIHTNKYIPVIYLTAHDDIQTINRAIETQPVGYLVKPFNRADLKTTLLLGLYKSQNNNEKIKHNHKVINLGFNYYFDEKDKSLYYKNKMIKLGIKEKKLLNLLVKSNGDDVSFASIEDEVWEGYTVSKLSIRNMVLRLRNKMDYKFIQSIPYFGFRLLIKKEKKTINHK